MTCDEVMCDEHEKCKADDCGVGSIGLRFGVDGKPVRFGDRRKRQRTGALQDAGALAGRFRSGGTGPPSPRLRRDRQANRGQSCLIVLNRAINNLKSEI